MSEPTPSSSTFQSALESEATKIVDQAETRGVTLRLIGALGIRMRSPTSRGASFGRNLTDIDFVGYSKQQKQIGQFFSDLGYKSNEYFNNVHGHNRMIFYNMEHKFQVDIFLDVFEMCHSIDFRGRLELDAPTVPLPELLASKLQIVELNEKDVKDMLAIFNDHDLSDNDSDRERINTKYLAKMCASDWGKYKTFTMNLEKITGFAPNYLGNDGVATERIKRTVASIEAEPKTTGWKMRTKVGERKRWYNLPDLPRTSLAEQSNNPTKTS